MNKPSTKLWILEDDEGVRFVYDQVLAIRYNIRFFETLGDFRQAILSSKVKPDLVIADLRLPDGNFIEYLGEGEKIKPPFIVVSSVDDLDILRTCFQHGAYDYLTKPFSKNEIIVKIEKFISGDDQSSSAEDLLIDQQALTATAGDKGPANLTMKEFQILALLHKKQQSVSKDEIISRVWRGVNVTSKTLDVHMFNLRKKLSEIGYEVQTVGSGAYLLVKNH